MCFGSTPDYSQAGAIQAQGAQRAADKTEQLFWQARADVAPWRESGGTAVKQEAGLFNLPGYTPVDPTATLQATPGYNWALQQGVNALDRSAASRGLALSGPQRNAVQTYGQNFALANAWQPYLQGLQSLSGQGLSAGGMSGNWAMQAGQQIGQDYMSAANAQAQAMIQEQNAKNQQGAGWMQGLGMLGSLALAPVTGGGSLIGAGVGALGNWLGGGGGGGGGWSGGYANSMPSLMASQNFGGIALPMAKGGTALKDQPYLVGERGPELFVPEKNGTVVPNHALQSEFTAFAPWRKAA